ncbi:hypothetical protein LCGC14_0847750 [marine sediment metagenome]|uniref:Uncharacterized protein n=1 Tax=marine sediment metagenome TaxID=412755 RepID=A0A0F9PB59_9ZZZZ|nr:hypothetical protein [bacterium]
MSKCPYCSKDLHLDDFFETSKRETKKGKIKISWGKFKGEHKRFSPYSKMWACPSCDTILGFSEWNAGS